MLITLYIIIWFVIGFISYIAVEKLFHNDCPTYIEATVAGSFGLFTLAILIIAYVARFKFWNKKIC